MRRLTKETCDMLFHIPTKGRVESLNVSVAGGMFGMKWLDNVYRQNDPAPSK